MHSILRKTAALLLAAAMMVTFMPLTNAGMAFADDDVITFDEGYETERTDGCYMFDSNSDWEGKYIRVQSDNQITGAVSSNEDVIKVTSVDTFDGGANIVLETGNLGEATVTVSDSAGNSNSCKVKVLDGCFIYATDELSIPVTKTSFDLFAHTNYAMDVSGWSSSNEEVISVDDSRSMGSGKYICIFTLHKSGEATITATDSEGSSSSVKITVEEADWELTASELTFHLSDSYEAWNALSFTGNDWPDSATSSDESIVKADMNGSSVSLDLMGGTGTAVVTVSDRFGKTRTCNVTVLPNDPTPFAFKEDSYTFIYYPQDGLFEPEYEYFYTADECQTSITDVTVDKEGIVEVEAIDGYMLLVRPIGAGTAVITATDEQGLTATIDITVAEGVFLDQSYFGSTNAEAPGSYDSQAVYGDTKLTCYCNVDGTVASYTAGGKTYTGTIKNGECVLTIPRITAKNVSVKFTNGASEFTSTAAVSKKKAALVKATAANITYTGKALKPKVTVKDGSYTLVKDKDYTVAYKNNTKVGVGTATITLKGNYTGTKTAKFDVRPKGTSISKLTPGKKKFTVKWKKNTAVKGYDIEYSNQKSFGNVTTAKPKYAESIRYTKNTVTSRTFTGLISGKTYYVRVRTYKTVNGKKIYSTWSTVKKVKVK